MPQILLNSLTLPGMTPQSLANGGEHAIMTIPSMWLYTGILCYMMCTSSRVILLGSKSNDKSCLKPVACQ